MIKKIYKAFLLLLSGVILAGCNQFIDSDINISPDSPSDINPPLAMSAIQARMGYTTVGGTDLARTVNMWTQQITGVDRQSLVTTNYTVKSEDANNWWNSTYAGTMMDIVQMKRMATEMTAYHYIGIADVMMAVSIGHTTDVFGDVPFSEAFQGDLGLAATYDKQEKVYEQIDQLLVEALVELNKDPGSFVVDGSYDYLFGGDIEKWKNIVYALQARFNIHRTKVSSEYYDKALAAAEMFDSSNDNDMQLNFASSSGQDNPLYQFQIERGDLSSCNTFISLLKREFGGKVDPRLPVYAYPVDEDVNDTILAGSYFGNNPGQSLGGLSQPGPAIAAQNSPAIFMSTVEVEYIKAEVYFDKVDYTKAREYAVLALETSLEKWGVADLEYVAAYTLYLETLIGDDLFKEIMIGKYLGCYYQLEVYNDFRRTDNIIGLIPNQNTSFSDPKIPSRFLYPTDEINLNPNSPKGVTQNNKVWWDDQM